MITTIRIKDLLKYLVILMVFIFTIIFITRYFLNKKENNKDRESNYSIIKNNNTFLSFIDLSIPVAKRLNDDKNNNEDNKKNQVENSDSTSRSSFLRILDIELPNVYEKESENETEEEVATDENSSEDNKQEERIQIKDTYTNQYKSVKVKNLTNIKLTESILKPDYNVKNKNNIIIYHTHTCESYTQTQENKYKPSGNYRTTDLRYSVVRVRR